MRVALLSCVVAAGLSLVAPLLPATAQTARTGRPAAATAAAAGEGGKLQESNEWTVGVAGGLLEGTNIRFAAEMAKVLDDRPNLRVLPMVTYGALGNIEDLLYLRGVDVTITSADVLDEFVRNGTLANIKNRIRYICSFYINEMHVYVRPEIRTLEDLAGKKVSFNTVGSAANLTGGIVFDRLKIGAEKVFINNSVALEKMRSGEIAGVVHVTGKPTDLFAKFKPEPGFHFLPIPFARSLQDYYVPTKLTSQDYPNLLKPGESVETIGVPQVLAVYNWPPETERYRRVARFVDYLFKRFDQFKRPPFHPKWNEISLSSSLPGWTRFRAAEELLASTRAPQADGAAIKQQFDDWMSARAPTGGRRMSEDETRVLFEQFRDWMKRDGGQPAR
ncbi:TAXI family TRAP transporter solute-binding subunit [Bradyrhizobium sp. SZCCHNR1098]|uniref:TAXI family TRAP transporter solute-binding subunit n=1 Tax=Bradyrhizobium sp. SZCCHNR1098 TaxID=3057370 RepID=UPI0029167C94|nr:TAXI family TRAP transporter solute-binding subunit [Bradyrhizobium sp. SZCCHNR1098]